MLVREEIDRLYEEYSNELFIYICRLTQSREVAEDILHDVFINIMRYSIKKDLAQDTVRAFLYKTARNLTINYIKRNKKIKFVQLTDELSLFSSDSLEESHVKKELMNGLNNAVSKLDPVSRSILVMKKELSLTFEEIAGFHGISEKTARRKMQAALLFIRKEMKQEGYLKYVIFILTVFLPLIVIYHRGGRQL